MDRRSFLKGAALAGLSATALGLAACGDDDGAGGSGQNARPNPDQIVWDREVDVLVAGGGGAGMVCACIAADAGLDVLVVDKSTHFGGCSNLAGGTIGWRGPVNLADGRWAAFTPQVAYDTLIDATVRDNKKNDRALAWAHVNNTAATHDFLIDHGMLVYAEGSGDMPSTSIGDYMERLQPGMPGAIGMNGSGLIQPLADAFWAKDGEILENHELIELIQDANGRVIGGVVQVTEPTDFGVQAKAGEAKLYFKANKAVMMGSGSWKGNLALRKLFDPRIPDFMPFTGQPFAYNDGSGIMAALNIGAALCTDQQNDSALYRNKFGTPWYNYRLDSGIAAPGLSVSANNSQHYILVNSSGERYVDDSTALNGYQIMDPTYSLDDLVVWMIFDENGRVAQNHDVTAPNIDPEYAFSADTLAELAAKIDVPASALEATVARYNGFVEAGADVDFGKPAAKLTEKIVAGPFYGVRVMFYVHDTAGGLWVDENMRVKDWDGNVIEGLYAGGESAGGLGVIGLPRCLTQGYIAGQYIVK
ncbi:MAG: FAD-dependent oxidoreductase [Coriobacteriia bacterium]|nr:FAD-dependent oxidoreductase [Coriobacteriia bacterium]